MTTLLRFASLKSVSCRPARLRLPPLRSAPRKSAQLSCAPLSCAPILFASCSKREPFDNRCWHLSHHLDKAIGWGRDHPYAAVDQREQEGFADISERQQRQAITLFCLPKQGRG